MAKLESQWAEVELAVRSLNRQLKHALPPTSLRFDSLARIQPRPGFLKGRKIERVIFFLKSNGCEWARDPEGAGGCSMCGHIAGTSRGDIPPTELVTQFAHAFTNHDFLRFPMLCVYNSGSFLNPREVPDESRREILSMIAKNDDIEHVIIESRPEYFNADVLRELSEMLKGKTIEIGVGLETHDETIRRAVLNKGVENQALEALKGKVRPFDNIRLLFYVLVKPPFLREGYALRNAVESVEYAFGIGADVVSLEPVSIQDFTIVDLLARAGLYRTPWIWTVIEVVKRTFRHDRLVRMGGFEFYPVPKEFVHNCARCNTTLVKAIDRFNSINTLDVFAGIDCTCKTESWAKETECSDYPSPSEILAQANSVNLRAIIEQMKADFIIRK